MKKIFILFLAIIFTIYGCKTDYTSKVAGTYKLFSEEMKKVRGNYVLELHKTGSFRYKKSNLTIFEGNWSAHVLREMTTIKFKKKGEEKWLYSGGAFNAPECNQIIPWSSGYFKLPSNEKVIFIKEF